LTDADPVTVGDQPDTTVDAVLTDGVGGTGNIQIIVPRSLTLPGGVLYDYMSDPDDPQFAFEYDIFLRNTGTNKQDKILEGIIILEGSHTLWL
jgi:hypothetical protein